MVRDIASEVAALLPLAPAFFHILIALAEGERHGYSIMRPLPYGPEGRLIRIWDPLIALRSESRPHGPCMTR